RKPKDKAKAEVGVQVVERWIMARIRHEIFYSLASLNRKRKLTAVCSHQTRIGNLDAHLI
ncbi:hypothetical protein QS373_26250, partial [Escherichia coli]|nr:hypothetical protein [Escherichia coli]